MDIKFINPFIEGTVNVLKTMAFIEPKAGKPYLKKDTLAIGDVSGIIGMTGAARGSLALSFSEKCIIKVVSSMLGEEHKEIDKDIEDAVGELTNMITGNARRLLEKDGYTITAAIPTVVSGKKHKINHILGGPSMIIPFDINGEPFVIDVCLSE